jgi:hypothetical protein
LATRQRGHNSSRNQWLYWPLFWRRWCTWACAQIQSGPTDFTCWTEWTDVGVNNFNLQIDWLVNEISFGTIRMYAANKKKKNSLVRVRERTIPTERPPLVGEVIVNFCG